MELTERDRAALAAASPTGVLTNRDGVKRQTVDRLVRLGLVEMIKDVKAVPSSASTWASPSHWVARLTDTGREERAYLPWTFTED